MNGDGQAETDHAEAYQKALAGFGEVVLQALNLLDDPWTDEAEREAAQEFLQGVERLVSMLRTERLQHLAEHYRPPEDPEREDIRRLGSNIWEGELRGRGDMYAGAVSASEAVAQAMAATMWSWPEQPELLRRRLEQLEEAAKRTVEAATTLQKGVPMTTWLANLEGLFLELVCWREYDASQIRKFAEGTLTRGYRHLARCSDETLGMVVVAWSKMGKPVPGSSKVEALVAIASDLGRHESSDTIKTALKRWRRSNLADVEERLRRRYDPTPEEWREQYGPAFVSDVDWSEVNALNEAALAAADKGDFEAFTSLREAAKEAEARALGGDKSTGDR